jgi:hypothetical protein
MSDCYYGEISIPYYFITPAIRKMLDESAEDERDNNPAFASISNCDARWGKFEDIEDFCKTKKVPFTAYSGSYYDYDPERRFFRPIIEDDSCIGNNKYLFHCIPLTAGDYEYIPMYEINKILEKEDNTLESVISTLKSLKRNYDYNHIPHLSSYVEDNIGIVKILVPNDYKGFTDQDRQSTGCIPFYYDTELAGEVEINPTALYQTCMIFDSHKKKIIHDIIEDKFNAEIYSIDILEMK